MACESERKKKLEKEGEERDGWRDHGGTVMGDKRVASDPAAALVMAPPRVRDQMRDSHSSLRRILPCGRIHGPWQYDGVRLSILFRYKGYCPIPFYKNETKRVYLSDFRIAAEILVFHLLSKNPRGGAGIYLWMKISHIYGF
jgi:hypothetical protein